ncbi:MAG: hypothetical protein ACP5DZ_06280 [Bacteroidales bacterium]
MEQGYCRFFCLGAEMSRIPPELKPTDTAPYFDPEWGRIRITTGVVRKLVSDTEPVGYTNTTRTLLAGFLLGTQQKS